MDGEGKTNGMLFFLENDYSKRECFLGLTVH